MYNRIINILVPILIPILVNYTTCICDEPNSYCDPAECCGTSSDIVPYPNDCHFYMNCVSLGDDFSVEPTPIRCDNDYEYFDAGEMKCKNESGSKCEEPCINYKCFYSCDELEEYPGFIADPSNCNKYYLCASEAEPAEEYCGEYYKYFNGNTCMPESYNCCDGCTPYCEEENIEVVDPENCKRYYICEEKGIPPESRSYDCPEGEYFNPKQKRCVVEGDVKCKNRCDPTRTTMNSLITHTIEESVTSTLKMTQSSEFSLPADGTTEPIAGGTEPGKETSESTTATSWESTTATSWESTTSTSWELTILSTTSESTTEESPQDLTTEKPAGPKKE